MALCQGPRMATWTVFQASSRLLPSSPRIPGTSSGRVRCCSKCVAGQRWQQHDGRNASLSLSLSLSLSPSLPLLASVSLAGATHRTISPGGGNHVLCMYLCVCVHVGVRPVVYASVCIISKCEFGLPESPHVSLHACLCVCRIASVRVWAVRVTQPFLHPCLYSRSAVRAAATLQDSHQVSKAFNEGHSTLLQRMAMSKQAVLSTCLVPGNWP